MELANQQLSIINEVVDRERMAQDGYEVLQCALDRLTAACKADRGLIWQIVGDQLAVTNECASDANRCFVGTQLGSQESTDVVLEFLSRFPDESGVGIIYIADIADDSVRILSPRLAAALQRSNVNARLLMQLRSRGIFSGFVELQQTKPRVWNAQDSSILQPVVNLLSVLIQQNSDQTKIAMDAKEMKLLLEVAYIFRESYGLQTAEAIVKSVQLIAAHTGFANAQAFLAKDESLFPLIDDGKSSPLALSDADNLFVATYQASRGKLINVELPVKLDPFFGDDMAIILPLISNGERLGVIGLWQRLPNTPQYRPQDRELALTIAGHLSLAIESDRKVRQLRSDVSD